MTKFSFAAEQTKIAKQIQRLRKKAEQLQSKRRKPILASIVRSMKEHSLTPEDIAAAWGGRTSRTSVAVRRPSSKRAVAPKYRNPKTGETWSGRGRAPRWITEAEATGTHRESFSV